MPAPPTLKKCLQTGISGPRSAELTDEELLRELASDPDDFAERDRLERAVRLLVGVGLLQRDGRFVLPTRAAVVFQALSPA